MMLVNHRVVVTQVELNAISVGAMPVPMETMDGYYHDQAIQMLTSLPVVLAPQWPQGQPVDCGDGWLAIAMDETIYAWNDAELKASLERMVQESAMKYSFAEDSRSVGLFQQLPTSPWMTGLTP